ncbi:MAG: hypothetical protein ABI333_11200 [bacterium]
MRTQRFGLLLSVLLALGAGACGDDDGGNGNNNQNNSNGVVTCGDGVAAGVETCDGADLRSATCTSIGLGYTGGTLACNASCTGWDVALCMTGACGDAQLDTGELCDTTNLDGNDCTTINQGFTGGTLACGNGCQSWDTSLCTGQTLDCGNGNIDAGEDCDGANHGSDDCTTLGFGFTGGTLGCNTDCTWDTTGCTTVYCGNFVIEGSELCDGDEVGAAGCTTLGLGYSGGTLGCQPNCTAYDVSQCTGGTATCGNATVEGGEVCDGADLNGQDCSSISPFTGGTLTCDAASSCQAFDTSQCVINPVCGNGVRETPEQCDGNDLQGVTCADFGFTGGTLACGANCLVDFSGCTSGVPGWTCIPGFYADGACDCGCGVVDSDCTDATVGACDWCDSPGGCNGVGGQCPGIIDPANNAQCTATTCGDGVQEGAEQCDLTDLQGAGCEDLGLGFAGGTLACQANCLFDITQCTMPVCGNNTAEGAELCDGADLAQNDCTTIGQGFGGGTLACNNTCDGWVTTQCTAAVCGNNTAEGGEVCDGADLGGNDCTTLGLPYTGGTLSCDAASSCQAFDTSQCVINPVCGNGVQETGEQCDGNDLQGADCTDFTFTGGVLTCGANCLFDFSGCTSGVPGWTCVPGYYGDGDCDCGCGVIDTDCANATVGACDWCDSPGGCNGIGGQCPGIIDPANNAQCTATTCGDGVQEGAEQCDLTDLQGAGCEDLGLGFAGGTLACQANCLFDITQCTLSVCGDGTAEGLEECDGADLGQLAGATCADLGFTGGTISCSNCAFDLSTCTGGVPGWNCIPGYYGDGACDCGCGIIDSDCADATVGSCDWCDSPGGCNGAGGSCPGTINPNNNTQCL